MRKTKTRAEGNFIPEHGQEEGNIGAGDRSLPDLNDLTTDNEAICIIGGYEEGLILVIWIEWC